MFGNLQGMNPMGLSANLSDYKNKQYFTNIKMSPTLLRQNKKQFKGYTQWKILPLGPTILFKTEKLTKHRQQNKDEFLLKIFRSLTK